MRAITLRSISIALTFSSVVAVAAPNNLVQKVDSAEQSLSRNQNSLQEFLKNLGYRDRVSEIDKTLAENPDLKQHSREVLESNRKHYEIFNVARDLGVEFGARAMSRMQNADNRAVIIEFVSGLLQDQPLSLPGELPPGVWNTQNTSERWYSEKRYLWDQLLANMQISKDKLVSDMIYSLYGEKDVVEALYGNSSVSVADRTQRNSLNIEQIGPTSELAEKIKAQMARLDQLSYAYFKRTYQDQELGQGRLLGRALAAILVREARLKNHPEWESELREAALKKGEVLDNYISDTLYVADAKGNYSKTKIDPFDFIMEYSRGREAFSITGGVLPSGFFDRIYAAWNGLYTNLFVSALAPDEDDIQSALDEQKKKISLWDRFRFWVIQQKVAQKGYSHVGVTDVFEDSKSGVKMVWAFDAYPDTNWGFVRQISIDRQFSLSGPYSRLGIVKYDHKKLYKEARRQYRKSGYRGNIWDVDVYQIQDGDMVPTEERSFLRPVVTQQQVDSVFAKFPENPTDEQAEEVFKYWWTPGMREFVNQAISGRQAKGFAYGFKNSDTTVYCSLFAKLVYLSGANIDPQANPDRWAYPITLMHKMGVERVQRYKVDQPIIAPAGFSWQTSLLKSHTMITYGASDFSEAEAAKFTALRSPLNLRLTQALRPNLSLVGGGLDQEEIDSLYTMLDTILVWRMHTTNPFLASGVTQPLEIQKVADRLKKNKTTEPEERKDVALELDRDLVSRSQNEMRQFLRRLGFQDHEREARLSLARSVEAKDSVQKQKAERRLRNESALAAARELAVLIVSEIKPRLMTAARVQADPALASSGTNTPVVVDANVEFNYLADLAGNLLALQPLNPPLNTPVEILLLPEEQRELALQKYLEGWARLEMQRHSRMIVANIADVIYGQEAITRALQADSASAYKMQVQGKLNRIYSLVSAVVERMYLDADSGETRFLGRAVLALAAREAQGNTEFMTKLRENVLRHGFDLEVFLGSTWAVQNRAGRFARSQVQSDASVVIADRSSWRTRLSILVPRLGPDWAELAKVQINADADSKIEMSWVKSSISGQTFGLEQLLSTTNQEVFVLSKDGKKAAQLYVPKALGGDESLSGRFDTRFSPYYVKAQEISQALQTLLPESEPMNSRFVRLSMSPDELKALGLRYSMSMLTAKQARKPERFGPGLQVLNEKWKSDAPRSQCNSIVEN